MLNTIAKTILFTFLSLAGLNAADWSITEIHHQTGSLKDVGSGKNENTGILTFQHASGWKYGDNFFFFDYNYSDYAQSDSMHGEFYPNYSVAKITGAKIGGPLRDIGVTLGLDISTDVNMKKYIPGLRFDWNAPGFIFLNTLVAAYIDDSDGNGIFAFPEKDSWITDTSYAYPFSIKSADFSVEGHMEYVAERDNFQGGTNEAWFLSQLQLRYDVGKSFFHTKGKAYVGIEWQYWNNKLGSTVDENAIQSLLVWRF